MIGDNNQRLCVPFDYNRDNVIGLQVDLGLATWINAFVRLRGVFIHDQEPMQDYYEDYLLDKECVMKFHARDAKYTMYVADLWRPNLDPVTDQNPDNKWIYVNSELTELGFARRYHNEKGS